MDNIFIVFCPNLDWSQITTGGIRYRIEVGIISYRSHPVTKLSGYHCFGTFPKNICLAWLFTSFNPFQNSFAQRSGFPSGLTFMTPKTVPPAHRIAITFPDVSSVAQPGSGRSDPELKGLESMTLTSRSWRSLPFGVCATSGFCVDNCEVIYDFGKWSSKTYLVVQGPKSPMDFSGHHSIEIHKCVTCCY